MAVSFGEQIHALTGFDGDSASASEIGENFDDVTAEWMNTAVREIINILPPHLLEQTAVIETNQNMNDGDGHDVEGKVLSAFRALNSNFSDGQVYECRRVPFTASFKVVDPDSVEFATPTDPVYYFEPQTDNTAAELHIRPKDTGQNVSKVLLANYPVFDADGSGTNINIKTATSITNFPNQAEYLVVLRAAIFAAQYQLAFEEDEDLFEPIISTLTKKYEQGITALLTKKLEPSPKGSGKGKGLDLSKALAGLTGGGKK